MKYCRILLLTKQLGPITYFDEREQRELLDLKKRLGFDDPRFHVENCDLCGNTAFREGYKEQIPLTTAFNAPPEFSGYLQPAVTKAVAAAPAKAPASKDDFEALVKAITEQVLASMK